MTGSHQSDFFFEISDNGTLTAMLSYLSNQRSLGSVRRLHRYDTEGNGAFHTKLIEGHIKNHIVPPPRL